jgi:hypothetical protein
VNGDHFNWSRRTGIVERIGRGAAAVAVLISSSLESSARPNSRTSSPEPKSDRSLHPSRTAAATALTPEIRDVR